MSEFYEQALYWINAVWRRRWAALAVAWFVCLAGWYVVASKPDTYTATSRIFIDSASVLQPLLRGLAVERDVAREVQVMKQTVNNQLNMERVARLTDLDLEITTPLEMQNLVKSLRARTQVDSDGYLFSISFTDTDPVRARDVAEALSTVFIEQNLGEKSAEIENARTFLDRQIASYEVQLEKAESDLANFQVERLSALPDRQNATFQLEKLRATLQSTEAELRRALVTRDNLRQRAAARPVSALELQIADVRQKLDDALFRFTDEHPTVITLNRQLAELIAKRDAELQGAAGDAQTADAASDSGSGTANPELSEVQSALTEAEANVAVLQDKVEQLRGQTARLSNQIAQIPVAEAELSRLNRDYDVLRSKHAELVSRREQAILSQQKEAGTDRLQFRIVDPPRVPLTPNGPPRSIMVTAVLVFALGIGVAFAMFLSVIKETFTDAGKLRKAFNVPVLGTVSAVQTPAQRTMALAGRSTFLSMAAALFFVYAVLSLNIADIRTLSDTSAPFLENAVLRVGSILGI